MGNPLTNLGDYNVARDLVKAAGGKWDIVYNNIGKTFVAKATPKLLLKGGFIGAGIIGLAWVGREVSRFMNERKQLIENEPALKNEFIEILDANPPKTNDDPACDDEANKQEGENGKENDLDKLGSDQ